MNKSTYFRSDNYKVLKQVHPNLGISIKALEIIDNALIDISSRLISESVNCTNALNKKTITSREFQTAIRLIYPGELAKHGVSEGTKAVTKAACSNKQGLSTSRRDIGITFKVSTMKNLYKRMKYSLRFSKCAGIYLAATIEYLSAEILELAGNAACDMKRKRISPRDIFLAISSDEELSKLFKNSLFPQAGIIPHINSALLSNPKSNTGVIPHINSELLSKPKSNNTFFNFNSIPIDNDENDKNDYDYDEKIDVESGDEDNESYSDYDDE